MSGYSQNDPQWAADFLGSSPVYRMGVVNGDTDHAAGCFVTSGANVCQALGHNITPGDLNRLATSRGLINGNGDITRWDWLSVLFPDIEFVESLYWGDTAAPLEYFNIGSDLNTEVIVMIDDSPAPGLNTHFMRVVGLSGEDVIVDDPWGAVRQGVSAYGKRWNPPVSAKSLIYRAIKYKRGQSQAQPPAAPQGDEMIVNADQARDAYNLLRGDEATSDDEINGTAGARTWEQFAQDAKPEVAARNEYRKALENHVADLTAQVGQLSDQIVALGARPTAEQLQTAQVQAEALAAQLQEKTTELQVLKQQVDESALPVATPQWPPATTSSPIQALVAFIKGLFTKKGE